MIYLPKVSTAVKWQTDLNESSLLSWEAQLVYSGGYPAESRGCKKLCMRLIYMILALCPGLGDKKHVCSNQAWIGGPASHHRLSFIRPEPLPAHSARLNIFGTAFIKYFSHKAKLSTFLLRNVTKFIQLKITGQLIIFGKI